MKFIFLFSCILLGACDSGSRTGDTEIDCDGLFYGGLCWYSFGTTGSWREATDQCSENGMRLPTRAELEGAVTGCVWSEDIDYMIECDPCTGGACALAQEAWAANQETPDMRAWLLSSWPDSGATIALVESYLPRQFLCVE